MGLVASRSTNCTTARYAFDKLPATQRGCHGVGDRGLFLGAARDSAAVLGTPRFACRIGSYREATKVSCSYVAEEVGEGARVGGVCTTTRVLRVLAG